MEQSRGNGVNTTDRGYYGINDSPHYRYSRGLSPNKREMQFQITSKFYLKSNAFHWVHYKKSTSRLCLYCSSYS